MDKLKATIEKYSRWAALSVYIDRMEAHLESDFSLSLENAKALLESIGKEICTIRGVVLTNSSLNGVLKKAFIEIGYTNNNLVSQISASLSTIGQQVGELRNEIGILSHGRSLDEIKERNNKVNLLTREFLIDSTLIVAIFLIRAFEDKLDSEKPPIVDSHSEKHIDYAEATDFNDFWDDAFGEFEMGNYSYTASEILYRVDYEAYKTEYATYIEGEQEELGEDS